MQIISYLETNTCYRRGTERASHGTVLNYSLFMTSVHLRESERETWNLLVLHHFGAHTLEVSTKGLRVRPVASTIPLDRPWLLQCFAPCFPCRRSMSCNRYFWFFYWPWVVILFFTRLVCFWLLNQMVWNSNCELNSKEGKKLNFYLYCI